MNIRNIGIKQIGFKTIDETLFIEKPNLLFDKTFLDKFIKDNEFPYALKLIDSLRIKHIINRYEYIILKKMIIIAKIHYNKILSH
jgi:hypothetical protein